MAQPRRNRGGAVAAAGTGTPSIATFTRVSKTFAGSEDYVKVHGSKKRKAVDQDTAAVPLPFCKETSRARAGCNIKRACIRADEDQENRDPAIVIDCIVGADEKPAKLFQAVKAVATTTTTTTQAKEGKKKPAPKQLAKGKGNSNHKTNGSGSSSTQRVTKAGKSSRKANVSNTTRIDDLLERARQAKAEANEDAAAATPSQPPLPPHLADMARLHRAFLKTMTLHFAHNGVNVPVDMRAVTPHVARAWGKRAVTVQDIRRCIAIQNHDATAAASPFVLTDYGRGKICIELDASKNDGVGKPIQEEMLCRQFEANLRQLCSQRAAEQATDRMVDNDHDDELELLSLESLSLSDLPQAPIADLARDPRSANPLLARGHLALAEIKNGLAARIQERESKQQQASINTTMTTTITAATTTGTTGGAIKSTTSLLDRIRAKQLAKSQLPAGPSTPELERRAALQRVADVAATVSSLSVVNPLPRLAFTMAVLVGKLRDSLRLPVSKEEAAACVRLLAKEVAPDWIRILAVGGKENVVIQRAFQPVDSVIRERVDSLLG